MELIQAYTISPAAPHVLPVTTSKIKAICIRTVQEYSKQFGYLIQFERSWVVIYKSIIGLPFMVLHVILLLMLSLIWLQIHSWISMESLHSGQIETVGLLRRLLSGWHLVREFRGWWSSSQALAEAKYLEDSCCYALPWQPKQLVRLDKFYQGRTLWDLQLGSSHFIKLNHVSGVILGW